MADHDSDSSGADDVETNVVLGYASTEPTAEPFSQLGGLPTWLDGKTAPSGALAKCKTCSGLMNLLLQIRGDLDDFPTHERRLYIWACRRNPCRRKEGSIRAFRAIRTSAVAESTLTGAAKETRKENPTPTARPSTNLGDTVFGVKASPSGHVNPLSMSTSSNLSRNPFSSSVGATQTTTPAPISSMTGGSPPKHEKAETLPQTFAQKVRLSTAEVPARQVSPVTQEPWPLQNAFPEAYPGYFIDADKEYIDVEPVQSPLGVRVDRESGEASGSSAEEKAAFESSMDKTFQKFADRLAQNPEQVLRYEYRGQPLLYSKDDAVGKLLAPAREDTSVRVKAAGGFGGSKMPRCANCGAERFFQLQMTPHAITELEAEEMSIEGMDWGTIILGVCGQDCNETNKRDGQVGYVEEWVGVQWEELTGRKKSA